MRPQLNPSPSVRRRSNHHTSSLKNREHTLNSGDGEMNRACDTCTIGKNWRHRNATARNPCSIAHILIHISYLRALRICRCDVKLHQPTVFRLIQQGACSRHTITACTTCLLIVRLECEREICMNYATHIGFIDAHPECIGSYEHWRRSTHKSILHLSP